MTILKKNFFPNTGFTRLNPKNSGRRAGNLTGFTLIEVALVISIIVFMSVIVYANFREINDQGKVMGVTDRVKADLQLAQNYSLAGRAKGTDRANGWGVYFNRNLNKYIVFADLNSNKTFDYPTKLLIRGTETVAANAFTDSSMAANRVTVTNAIQDAGAGKPDGTTGFWTFDGTGDFLNVPANSNFDFGTENFAIDLWIYAGGTGSKRAIMYKGDGAGTLAWYLVRDSDDLIKFRAYYDAVTFYDLQSNPARQAIAASTWYHVAVTKEGNFLRLFINGRVHNTKKMTVAVRTLSAPVKIGIEDDGLNSSWNGRMDEIRISKGANRWKELFNTPSGPYNPNDETFRETKLPPGIVFERLYKDATGVSELNVFFNPTDHLMYLNNNAGTEPSTVWVNNAGVEGTGGMGDTAKVLKIYSSGLVENQNY